MSPPGSRDIVVKSEIFFFKKKKQKKKKKSKTPTTFQHFTNIRKKFNTMFQLLTSNPCCSRLSSSRNNVKLLISAQGLFPSGHHESALSDSNLDHRLAIGWPPLSKRRARGSGILVAMVELWWRPLILAKDVVAVLPQIHCEHLLCHLFRRTSRPCRGLPREQEMGIQRGFLCSYYLV